MSRVLRITDANTRKISNAVFDNWTSGAPDGWTSTGTPTTAQVISEGTVQSFASAYALDIENASTQAVRGWYQDITDVNEGQTYYISVYVKPTTGILRLYAWDGGGFTNAALIESVAGTDWQQLIVEKVAASGGIRIGLIAFDANSQGVFDLVQLATFNIEFIEGVYSTFFRVTNWEIQVPDYKGGGVFSSSPVAEGQKLIDGYWDNVTQTISFYLRGDDDTDITTQNAAANKLSELFNALQAARDFSKTSWVRDPVYMQYKAENETNYRYAFIANARIPQLADQYNIEFAQLVMKDLDLIIEHPVAFGMPPGEGAPVLSGFRHTYNSQNYGNYDENGVAEDTAEWVHVGNRHGLCNITNMHQGTGGANQIGGSLPRVIVTSGGTVYFGINTSLSDSGPFLNIIFYITRAGVGTGTGNWQYWDTSGTPQWSDLPTPTDTSSGFTETGIHSVSWRAPNSWSTNSPGGSLPTGYWVRFVHTGAYSTTPQINREIFTINKNYLEIPSGMVLGNITALAAMWGRNTSPGTGSIIDRLIGGLRSVSRGEDFQSIINLGGKQNHASIAISYDTGVSSTADISVEDSTGYVARSTAAAEKYVDITISGDLAQQYLGEFRVFVAIEKARAANVEAWLSYRTSTGMPFDVNEKQEIGDPGYTPNALLWDLGVMNISPDGNGGFVPDSIVLRISTDTDTTDNLDRLSLILIPVDEYTFDAEPTVTQTNTDSRWGSADTDHAFFGSAVFAKKIERSHFVITPGDGTREVQMRYVTRANGAMILQNNERQRLYLLPTLDPGPSGGNLYWQFSPYYLLTIRPLYNPRYLGMRGSN